MKNRYSDPMFYISSDKMPFTICIETILKEEVDGAALAGAVERAMKCYPYFRMRIKEEDGELIAVPNPLPVVVYEGTDIRPLGSAGVNYHLLALSLHGKTVNFYVSHVITDGGGFVPFVKTVLFCYFSAVKGGEMSSEGFRLPDDPVPESETAMPFPEEKMRAADALCLPKNNEYFRLEDGGLIRDFTPKIYRVRISAADVMKYSHGNDGSPCALVSSLMANAIRNLHPEMKKDIVSAISFNMRPALGNRDSCRLLCSALEVRYPELLRGADMSKICTCTRGMITLQSQPENVLYYAERKRRFLEETVLPLPGIEAKKECLGAAALADSVSNTFSVSYVGQLGLGPIEQYIDAIYNLTDGSTYRTLFIEISAVGDRFDLAFLQGFSEDVYYRAFLSELSACGLEYSEDRVSDFGTAKQSFDGINE